jgi:hypothetical protein
MVITSVRLSLEQNIALGRAARAAMNQVARIIDELQAFHVVHIPLHDFYSALGKLLPGAAAGISGQRPNSPAISQ